MVGIAPEHVGTLYTYVINKPQFQSPESRQALVRRIREALVKNVALQGVCKPITSVVALSKIERPEDRDFSFSRYDQMSLLQHKLTFLREQWKSGPENKARGEAWLGQIYKENLSTSTDHFKAHKDFDWISREITYGLYLSDHEILGPIETELVVLAGIAIQNLHMETAWHLRGIRRVGVSPEDVELVQQCVSLHCL